MDWGGFGLAVPRLAERVRGEVERFGFVLLGTVRRDGTPRISPVEAHFVQQHLMLVMIAGTWKVRDLERDSRVLLRTPVTNPATPECDLQLRGRVFGVDEPLRTVTADSIQATSGWRPHETWRFFSVAIREASCIEWDEDEMRLIRWDEVRGLRPTERRLLNMERSQYLPVEG